MSSREPLVTLVRASGDSFHESTVSAAEECGRPRWLTRFIGLTRLFPNPSFLANKGRLIERVYAELDDALAFARDVNDSGGIAWIIEGNSARLSRREIEEAIKKRSRRLVGR